MSENPLSNFVWEDKLTWFKSSSRYRTLDTIDGGPMEFEWNIFPGFTTLQLCHKVRELLSNMSTEPEDFTGRIIFMSMFNDISWGSKENERECELSAQLVSMYAKRFFTRTMVIPRTWIKRKIGTLSVKTVHKEITLDKTVGSRVWRHTQGSSGRPASDLGWGSFSKTAPESLSTGSPAGRTPPHGDGSMYSQANVRAGKVLRPPIRALPSVILDTDKVLREADGPKATEESLLRVERWSPRNAPRKPDGEPVRSRRTQAVTKDYVVWSPTFIIRVNTNSIVMWEHCKKCRIGLKQDSDFAGDLEDSKSTSGGTVVRFWKSYICSNQFDV